MENISSRVFLIKVDKVFDKVAGLRRHFPVNFLKFLKTAFLQNTSDDYFICKNHALNEYILNPFY